MAMSVLITNKILGPKGYTITFEAKDIYPTEWRNPDMSVRPEPGPLCLVIVVSDEILDKTLTEFKGEDRA